jgi:hypothetical protein
MCTRCVHKWLSPGNSFLILWKKKLQMKQELILVADKIESIKCKTHNKSAKIEVVDGAIQINSCCKEHEQFLERQIEYEMYKLFNKEEEEESTETLSILRHAV